MYQVQKFTRSFSVYRNFILFFVYTCTGWNLKKLLGINMTLFLLQVCVFGSITCYDWWEILAALTCEFRWLLPSCCDQKQHTVNEPTAYFSTICYFLALYAVFLALYASVKMVDGVGFSGGVGLLCSYWKNLLFLLSYIIDNWCLIRC